MIVQTPKLPELGSRISLISKANFRYEGTLINVDAKGGIISLADVKMFGTEDRQTEHPVAPENKVIARMSFRAAGIKDVRVVSINPLHDHSAILKACIEDCRKKFSQQFFQ